MSIDALPDWPSHRAACKASQEYRDQRRCRKEANDLWKRFQRERADLITRLLIFALELHLETDNATGRDIRLSFKLQDDAGDVASRLQLLDVRVGTNITATPEKYKHNDYGDYVLCSIQSDIEFVTAKGSEVERISVTHCVSRQRVVAVRGLLDNATSVASAEYIGIKSFPTVARAVSQFKTACAGDLDPHNDTDTVLFRLCEAVAGEDEPAERLRKVFYSVQTAIVMHKRATGTL